jgi:anaerobic selenocysteine-containing dehydrogenase
LGRTEPWLYDSDEQLIRTVLDSSHPWIGPITYERLWAEGFVRFNPERNWLPFAEGGFPTKSGKAELYSQTLLDQGLDPLPSRGDMRPTPAGKLQLITGKTLHFLNSGYSHMDRHCRREGRLFIELNAQDAELRSLADGALVQVYNEQGQVSAECRISTRVRPGIAWMPFGGLQDATGRYGSVNVLTPEEPTDWGGGSGFYDTFVDVIPSNISVEAKTK